MSRYKRKPSFIEAERAADLINWAVNAWDKMPNWVVKAWDKGDILCTPQSIRVKTPSGWLAAEGSDMVILGAPDDIYPCKSERFAELYEKA